jgi:hypothetical protein
LLRTSAVHHTPENLSSVQKLYQAYA